MHNFLWYTAAVLLTVVIVGTGVIVAILGAKYWSAFVAIVKTMFPSRPLPDYPHDREITSRKRFGRMVQTVVILVAVFTLPSLLLFWFLGEWVSGFSMNFAALFLGSWVGIQMVAKTLPYVTVAVDNWMALVTQDIFTGELVAYGPGLHPRFIWEQVDSSSHQSMRVVTKTHKESFPTLDDDIQLTFQYSFRPLIKLVTIFSGVDESTIDERFTGIISGEIAQSVRAVTAENALGIFDEEYNERLESLFGEDEMRNLYGVELPEGSTEVIDRDYSDEFQKARSAIAESSVVVKAIASMMGVDEAEYKRRLVSGEITPAEHRENMRMHLGIKGEGDVSTSSFTFGDMSWKDISDLVTTLRLGRLAP